MELIQDFTSNDSFSSLERSQLMTTHASLDGGFYLSILMEEMGKDVKMISPTT